MLFSEMTVSVDFGICKIFLNKPLTVSQRFIYGFKIDFLEKMIDISHDIQVDEVD